eukprot:4797310-Amphidinium_carterae.1
MSRIAIDTADVSRMRPCANTHSAVNKKKHHKSANVYFPLCCARLRSTTRRRLRIAMLVVATKQNPEPTKETSGCSPRVQFCIPEAMGG